MSHCIGLSHQAPGAVMNCSGMCSGGSTVSSADLKRYLPSTYMILHFHLHSLLLNRLKLLVKHRVLLLWRNYFFWHEASRSLHWYCYFRVAASSLRVSLHVKATVALPNDTVFNIQFLSIVTVVSDILITLNGPFLTLKRDNQLWLPM